MLYIKFQASGPRGSEEEDVWIFSYVFLWFEPRSPGPGPSWTLEPTFEQTSLKTISQVVLKKRIFEYISIHFYGSNQRPLAQGHPGPWDLHLNKLGKGQPGNAIYQISSILAKQFWRRRFLSIFHCWTQDPPWQGHFGPQGHHLNKLGRGPLGNATYQILRP